MGPSAMYVTCWAGVQTLALGSEERGLGPHNPCWIDSRLAFLAS